MSETPEEYLAKVQLHINKIGLGGAITFFLQAGFIYGMMLGNTAGLAGLVPPKSIEDKEPSFEKLILDLHRAGILDQELGPDIYLTAKSTLEAHVMMDSPDLKEKMLEEIKKVLGQNAKGPGEAGPEIAAYQTRKPSKFANNFGDVNLN